MDGVPEEIAKQGGGSACDELRIQKKITASHGFQISDAPSRS